MPNVIGNAMKFAKLIFTPSAIVAPAIQTTPMRSEPITYAAGERRDARDGSVAPDAVEDARRERDRSGDTALIRLRIFSSREIFEHRDEVVHLFGAPEVVVRPWE